MAYGTLAADSITPTTTLSVTGGVSTGSIVSSNTFGFKNRIINGAMRIAQRATSATITAGSTIAAGYSTVDRFYVYCTGANVTAAQVAGTAPVLNNLQITGAASVTAIGVGQRIEAQNSADLAGQTATLSVNLSNSLLTTVTWTAYYATTTDTFGTLASPTRTQIATGSWTVTSTLTNYNAQITVPSAATTGIEIVLTVGAQTSGTWVIGNVQLEAGAVATGFDYRSITNELSMCQRYLPCLTSTTTGANTQVLGYGSNYSSTGGTAFIPFQVTPRVAPTSVSTTGTFSMAIPGVGTYTVSGVTFNNTGLGGFSVSWTGTAMGTGTGGLLFTTNAQIQFIGCEL
jgi:hypothetical protein